MDSATATLQVAYSLDLLTFVLGWAVVLTAFSVSILAGWSLYAGLWK